MKTKWGFVWGPFDVIRCVQDARIGWVLRVCNTVTGEIVEVRASPKGTKTRVEKRSKLDKKEVYYDGK
jgi:hypothetical protein